MRHVHFVIGPAERDAWLRHMRTALDELALDPRADAQLWDYLVMAAHSLVNAPGRARPAGPRAEPGVAEPASAPAGRYPRVSLR